jgi:8-oxo-dGTP pyrophosphatase MutT (NUDIX family)
MSRRWAPDCWDAPGGHIEQGESDFDALAREMLEELGVVVLPDGAHLVARLTGPDYDARVFFVDAWSGEPENRAPEEHDDLAWFDEEQIARLVLADPDLLDIVVDALGHAAGTDD